MSKELIARCVSEVGSQVELVAKMKPHLPARLAGSFKQGHVSNWIHLDRKSPVPPGEYVMAMVEAVEGVVKAHELPRIPCVKAAKDFWHFSQAGRELAALHIDYETVEPFAATLDTGKRKLAELEANDYYVTKMKHPKVKNGEGKSVNDLSTVIYNHAITVQDIPVEAYDYVVNGKPAIAWVIERQCLKTDKASGVVNDANDWAVETMNNPKYPLELLLRVITVSLETNKIVNGLPALDID